MPVCSVLTCEFSKEGHAGQADGIDFHPFPKSQELKNKWIQMSGRRNWEPKKKHCICSRHFRENDYTVKRSGKRYLKTTAIPCEYVVYQLSAVSDEESPEHEQSNPVEVKAESQEHPAEGDQARGGVRIPERELFESFFQMDQQPSTSGNVAPTMRALMRSQEPDSTIYDSENTCEPWERFLPGQYFGQRLPLSIFEEASQEVGSSSFDDRYRRDVGSAINPYPPVDLGPHLQQLPLPRTPEPPIIDEETQDSIATSSNATPQVAYQRGKAKLESIRKIVSGRKSSRKLTAAALAVVEEAQSLKIKLQTGLMNDHDKATAVIALQNKQIAKLNILYKRLRKKIKKISAVLRKDYKKENKQMATQGRNFPETIRPESWNWHRVSER